MRRFRLVVLATALAVAVIALGWPKEAHAAVTSTCGTGAISGSMLQPTVWIADHPSPSFDLSAEASYLARACVRSLIVNETAETDLDGTVLDRFYAAPPSSPVSSARCAASLGDVCSDAFLPAVLDAATRAGIKVYVGLQTPRRWDAQAVFGDWAAREAATSAQIARDIWSQFGPAIAGWYLTPELEPTLVAHDWLGQPMPPQALWAPVTDYYRQTSAALHALSPALPVLVAPAFHPSAPANDPAFATMLSAILGSGVDVVMVQDRTGEDPTVLSSLAQRFAAIRTQVSRYNQKSARPVALWADAELYRILPGGWQAAPVSQIKQAVSAEAPRVVQVVSFSFDHYISPLGFFGTSSEYATYQRSIGRS